MEEVGRGIQYYGNARHIQRDHKVPIPLESAAGYAKREGSGNLLRSDLFTPKKEGVAQVLMNPEPIMEPDERYTSVTFLNLSQEGNHKLTF